MVVFVYQGYRDTIDTFHGKFDTLEAAENHIYQDLLKEVQEFLDTMEQKKNGTYVSEQTKTLKQVKDTIISDMGVEYYEESLKDYETRDAELTEHALKSLEYYENTDWKGELKKVSQTPKPSIQDYPNKKMYEGYSQRYDESQGNYPYIVFDPSFVPPSKEMNAEYTLLDGIREEFKDAESFEAEGILCRNCPMAGRHVVIRKDHTDEDGNLICPFCHSNKNFKNIPETTYLLHGGRREDLNAETFEARDNSWCVNHGWIRGGTKVGDIIPCLNCNDMICDGCRCGGCGNCNTSDCCECSHNQAAESFGVEFNEWADQEMMSHGKDISFKDWAQDEGMKHGNTEITEWVQHEDQSHDARYGAEDNTESIKSAIMKLEKALGKMDGATYKMHDLDISAQPTTIAGFEMSRNGEEYDGGSYIIMKDGSIINAAMGNAEYGNIADSFEEMNEKIMQSFGADEGIVEKYKHGIELREFPNSSSVYQKGRLVKQYRGDGHRIRATSKAQQLEHSYKPKSFFSESKSKKTKYGMIAAGVITAFALLPEIKKRF